MSAGKKGTGMLNGSLREKGQGKGGERKKKKIGKNESSMCDR